MTATRLLLAEKDDMTTLRFAVGTIIGAIRVCVGRELIIAASAASAAATIQSKVGVGYVILENLFGSGEMPGVKSEISSAESSNCE